MFAPITAPEFARYRIVTADDDATSLAKKSNGLNAQGFTHVTFQIVPIDTATPPKDFTGVNLGTSNPVVTVYAWNEALDRYIPLLPSPVPTSPGAGKAYSFVVSAYGTRLMVGVTGVSASEGVAVFASGFDNESH